MNIHEKVRFFISQNDVQPIQFSFQVGEGLDQLFQIRLAPAFPDVNVYFFVLSLRYTARDAPVRRRFKAGEQVGMGTKHLLQGSLQPVRVRPLRQ